MHAMQYNAVKYQNIHQELLHIPHPFLGRLSLE